MISYIAVIAYVIVASWLAFKFFPNGTPILISCLYALLWPLWALTFLCLAILSMIEEKPWRS